MLAHLGTTPFVNRATRSLLLLFVLLSADHHFADEAIPDEEIEYLLHTVGESGCTFIRNGEERPATEAESHLRLKYRNGRRWAPTADKFIDRLASKSSWSGKPYYIRCGDSEAVLSRDWLSNQLTAYRESNEVEISEGTSD